MSFSSLINRSSLSQGSISNSKKIAKILLIGETGAGKSTLINYFYNHFHKGTLNNLKNIIPFKHHLIPTEQYPHEELSIGDDTQSKTNVCTQYAFTDPITHAQYVFLDTPGLSDTRGSEQNDINLNKILEAITQLGNLTSVIIVVNGSVSRLTASLRYTLSCLNGNIPDVVLEHAIVVLTNCTKSKSTFDLKVLNLHGTVYVFYMQNGAFVSDPKTWTKSTFSELESDWKNSIDQIKLILKRIDSFKQQVSIDAFIQMKQIRNEMKSIAHQARLEIMQIQKTQDELVELELELKQINRDLLIYKDHTNFRIIEKVEIIDAPYHSTLCANCNEVCHNDCHLNETCTMGSQVFLQCSAMKNGICQKCPNHCSYRYHYHAKKTVQRVRETLHKILTDFKNKYDKAHQNRSHCHERLLTISETKALLEKTLEQKINELTTKSKALSEICSSFNLAEEYKELINQLKIESASLRNIETKLKTKELIQNLMKFVQVTEASQEARRQQLPAMRVIYANMSSETKPIEVKEIKTSELINSYQNTTHNTDLTKSILNELHLRAQGKSVGPLFNSDEIVAVNDLTDKYRNRSLHELISISRRLQQQIDNILGQDILKIQDVSKELLMENFTVRLLLDKAEKNEINRDDRSILYLSNSFPLLNFPNEPQSTTSLPYPNKESMPSPVYSPINSRKVPLGFSHLHDIPSVPYPTCDDPSIVPSLPTDFASIVTLNVPRSQSVSGPDATSKDKTLSPSSSVDHPEFMPMPMPMPVSIPLTPSSLIPMQVIDHEKFTNLSNSSAHNRLNNVLEQPTMPTANQHSLIPDVVPNSNNFRSSSEQVLSYQRSVRNSCVASQNISSLDTSQLLLKYANSALGGEDSQASIIFEELGRRCFGDYPTLIRQNRTLHEEKLKIHENQTIEELNKIQQDIYQRIRVYIRQDDVTLIEDIPVELIIEANAVKQLIFNKPTNLN